MDTEQENKELKRLLAEKNQRLRSAKNRSRRNGLYIKKQEKIICKLVLAINEAVEDFDEVMKTTASYSRGQALAAIVGDLSDTARHISNKKDIDAMIKSEEELK